MRGADEPDSANEVEPDDGEPRRLIDWVPIVLRLPLKAPIGLVIAVAGGIVANQPWFAELLGLTRPAAITFGILFCAAVLWLTEAVPLFVTSLAVLALELVWLAPSLKLEAGGPSLFLNAFFSDVTLLFLGGFVLSAGIERTRLDRAIARALLERAGSSPRRVKLAMMLVTALLAMWMSNTAACALMLGAATPIIARVPEGDGFRKALVLGIAFSANLGGLATPVSSPPNAIAMRYLENQGSAPGFGTWMLMAIPLLFLLQFVLVLYLARRFPTQLTRIELPREEVPQRLGRAQVLVLGVFLLTVAGWVFSSQLGLTSGTVALLPILVFFGTNLLRPAEIRNLPWDVILLIGGGLALGAAIDQSGLAAWASERLPTAGLSPFVLLGVIALFSAGVSSVMSNTAAINLIAPIVMGLSGAPHAAMLLVAAFACTLSMPLPVSTPPNAMAYGFSLRPDGRGEFSSRDMVGPGLFITVVGLALLALFSEVWFWSFLGF